VKTLTLLTLLLLLLACSEKEPEKTKEKSSDSKKFEFIKINRKYVAIVAFKHSVDGSIVGGVIREFLNRSALIQQSDSGQFELAQPDSLIDYKQLIYTLRKTYKLSPTLLANIIFEYELLTRTEGVFESLDKLKPSSRKE
jgi:hypothetical protein